MRRLPDGSGIAVSVQLPWYRSLWLSAVDGVEVTVNGVPVPKDRIRFELEGRSYTIDELPEQSETLWFVADRPDVDRAARRGAGARRVRSPSRWC